jgi:hypothetical protein
MDVNVVRAKRDAWDEASSLGAAGRRGSGSVSAVDTGSEAKQNMEKRDPWEDTTTLDAAGRRKMSGHLAVAAEERGAGGYSKQSKEHVSSLFLRSLSLRGHKRHLCT